MKDDRLFELRAYQVAPGRLDALHDRFRDHSLALFAKHGIEPLGFWVTEEEEPQLVYLLAFDDKKAMDRAWAGFRADADWQVARAASIEDGEIVVKIESTLLRLTDYSPVLAREAIAPPRTFEFRIYRARKGRLNDLDTRFRKATMDLFAKHGATNLVYFHIEDGELGGDFTLVYLLAHDSREARNSTIEAFRADPDWHHAREESEAAAGGSLTEEGGVSIQLMAPTDYSRIM